MKTKVLFFLLCSALQISLGQTGNWPVNSGYVYFGANELDQSNAANYSLLQEKANGRTFLNSPLDIRFRIGNGEHLILSNSGHFGVGTISPRGKFDVDGAGDIYLADDLNTGTGQSLYLPGHIYLSPYNGSNVSYLQARRYNNAGTTSL